MILYYFIWNCYNLKLILKLYKNNIKIKKMSVIPKNTKACIFFIKTYTNKNGNIKYSVVMNCEIYKDIIKNLISLDKTILDRNKDIPISENPHDENKSEVINKNIKASVFFITNYTNKNGNKKYNLVMDEEIYKNVIIGKLSLDKTIIDRNIE